MAANLPAFILTKKPSDCGPPITVGTLAPDRSDFVNVCFGSKADSCSAATHVRFTPNSDRESTKQPLSTSDFETRVYFMNLYVGTIFEGLTEAFVNVRAALRPSDFLFLHLRFARDRRLFKGNLVSFGQFGCVRRHRHK